MTWTPATDTPEWRELGRKIEGGVEWVTFRRPDGEINDDCQCARCGSSCYFEDCDACGGEGFVWGEDIASGYDFGWIDEDETYPCQACRGKGGWWRCISSREWCQANPMPGREGVESTASSHEAVA